MDPFEQRSAERRAIALAAAHAVAERTETVRVVELPADAALAPVCELWSVGGDERRLMTVSANAVATTVLLGEAELIVCLDPDPDVHERAPDSSFVAEPGLRAALACAADLALRGVPRRRSGSARVTVHPEEQAQAERIAAIHRAAFSGPDEAELVDGLRESGAAAPGLSLVASDRDGGLVGHVLLSRAVVGPPDAPLLALAPVGVVPELQGRGVGEVLVASALILAASRGYGSVVVRGDPAYYGRFGFTPARAFGITPPLEWPDEAFQVLSLSGGRPPRGPMRYAAAFGL